MLISNPERRSLRFYKHVVGSWMVASVAGACTLSDYSYLGAKRDGSVTAGGQGGTTDTSTTTQPLAGGTGGEPTSTHGGATASSSTTSTGSTGTSGAGGTSADVQDGGATTAPGSDGGTAATSSSSTANGGVDSTGGGTTAVAGGGVASTGGNGNASGATAVASGGVSTGGATSTVGTGGAPPSTCQGCAVLDVPFTAKGQSARYLMRFTPLATVNQRASNGTGGGTSTTVTAEGTMKIRAFAPKLGNSQYQLFIQQDSGSYAMCFSGAQNLPAELSDGWVTLTWGLGTCATDTAIGRLGLELIADAATAAPVPSATTIWLDSIWIALTGNTIVGPFDFDSSTTVNASSIPEDYNQSYGALYLRPSTPTPPTTPPTGSKISWLGG